MRILTRDDVSKISGANFLPYVLYTIAANQTLSVTDYLFFDAVVELIDAVLGG